MTTLPCLVATFAFLGPSPDLQQIRARSAIVPRVDHHQHLVGPRATLAFPALPPAADLPPELDAAVRGRNQIFSTRELGDLYMQDAQVLNAYEEGQPWLKGQEAFRSLVTFYPKETRFVPMTYSAGDTTAWVFGLAVLGEHPQNRWNFTLGLKKEGGRWRIAMEQALPVPPPPFQEPITADDLIRDLDETGIERAVLLSVAYFFGSPSRPWPGNEYENVKAENDWVAAQAARYPDRLTAFCGVSPLRDYAVDEVRRCARDLKVKGLKLHFRSSRVDVKNPEHLEKVKRIFRTANELGLAIVVHTNVRPYGKEQAEIFLRELLPEAPDVVVQIAHLWGGNEYRPDALKVFADAVAAQDPRTKNLYFDLTEVEASAATEPDPKKALAEIAESLRRIGLNRIFYGSDAAAEPESPPTSLRWARLRHRLPLTNEEWSSVANNVAPYLK